MNRLEMLVKQHQAKADKVSAESVDWDRRKIKWLEALKALLGHLSQQLHAAGVPLGDIKPSCTRITEETLGTYEAPGLEVTIGRDLVRFIPIASVIIGGYGRVDVIGPRGELKLIASIEPSSDVEPDKHAYDGNWVWSAYFSGARRAGVPLDEEGVAKVLSSVLSGA